MHRPRPQVAMDGKAQGCQRRIVPGLRRLEVDESILRERRRGSGQGRIEQPAVERRIEQDQVRGARRTLAQDGNAVAPLHPRRSGAQLSQERRS